MLQKEVSHGKVFAKNSIIMLTRRIIDIIIGLVTVFFIARILGKEGQGAYSLVILLPTMLDTFFNMGLSPATIYYTAKKKYKIADIIRIDIVIGLTLSLAGIIVGGFIILLLSDVFFSGIPLYLLWFGLAGLPAKMGFAFLSNVFLGIQDYRTYNIIIILNRLLFLGILLVLYVFNPTIISNITAFVSADVVSLVFLCAFLFRKFNPFQKISISQDAVFDMLKFGIKAHLNNIVTFLNYRIDMFIISYFLGNGSVGLYSVAVSIAERIWMFSASIASVLFSTVSGMRDDVIKIKLTSTACRNVFFISLIVSGVLFAASGLLIKYTLGNDFNETALLLRLILPGIAAGSIAKVLSNYVAAVGKPEINLYISLLSVSCSIILDLVFIPRYGIIVAPIVSSLTYVLSAIIVTIYYKQRTGNSYRTILLVNAVDIGKYSALMRRLLRFKRY